MLVRAAVLRNSAIMTPRNKNDLPFTDFPMDDSLRRSALEYHLRQPPGKISVAPTKSLVNQHDLALAYTPGVAAACEEIVRGPGEERAPELEIEGEMHGDAALSAELRAVSFPRSRLKDDANLLIMPTLDAANIAFNLLKTAAGDGVTIGPILLGAARPVHVLTPSATVRRIVNMTALTVVDANASREDPQARKA